LDFKKLKQKEEINLKSKYDFKYILGQEHAKRALLISASG
jgi:predicted ATPase with chaperone activity